MELIALILFFKNIKFVRNLDYTDDFASRYP